ncbi:Down syndrome critical region protein 3 [Phytophthora citrophthora]|uniref:Down syndrome critical region protein 3 n=1 Tax=Phytophthora citrophthora TaxID=4793 RepID=A0AAD9G3C5_9STRA|nr:Down syndrome critical region protein 3 [Phytophthora citrophthora]
MTHSHEIETEAARFRKELLFVCCKSDDSTTDQVRQLHEYIIISRFLSNDVLPSPTDKILSPVTRALRARSFQGNNRMSTASTLDVKLNRIDRIFRPHEIVQGQVIISSPKGFSHQGLAMKVEGSARLQLSTKSTGLFDSFYNNVTPLELVYFHLPVAPAGKVPLGISKFPFEFELQGNDGQELLETYHGVYVSVKYEIICDCIRGIMKNKLHKTLEFVVEVPLKEPLPDSPEEFHITPESLENIRPQSLSAMPYFHITGKVHRTNCPVNLPFTGEIIVEEAKSPIKSVELQLIRVESVAHAEGIARDATEIQNVQIGWGDVCRQMAIPIYMIFPRLFTCPTMRTPAFKVEFETNVVVLFENGNMITENFPVTLYR